MSKKWPGGIITPTPITPTTSSAPGIWTLSQQSYWQKQGLWPSQQYYWGLSIFISGRNASADIGDICADSSGNTYSQLPIFNSLLTKAGNTGDYTFLNYYGNATFGSTPRAITFTTNNQIIAIRNSGSAGYPIISRYSALSGALLYSVLSSSTLGSVYCMAPSSDGNFFIGGSQSNNPVIYKALTLNGSCVSGSQITAPSGGQLHQIREDSSGNIYVGGYVDTGSGTQPFVAKYNSSFTVQWQRTLPAGANDECGGVAVDSSGSVYFAAGVSIGGAGYVIRLVKFDSNGTVQWRRDITAPSGNAVTKFLAIGADGFLYLVGRNFSNQNITFLAKYNTSGVIQWQRTLTWGLVRGACLDSNGNIVFNAINTSTSPASYAVFKVSPSGQLAGTYSVNGVNAVIAVSTYTDSASSITVSTSSLTIGSRTYSTGGTPPDMGTLSVPSVTTALTNF
jgi:hypothetical protein